MNVEDERRQKLTDLAEMRRQVAQLERELASEHSPPAAEGGDDEAEQASREALIAAERVSSMANLARAIAHEINNPLSLCMGYLKRAVAQAEQLDDAGPLQSTLHRLNRGTQRIRSIVGELQMLSEEMVGECEKLDLASVVERVSNLVPPELRSELDLELDSVLVWVDRPRLYQIAYNMIMPYLMTAREEPAGNVVWVHCGPRSPRDALLEVIADAAPASGTRTDLLSAIRGEYTPTTLPLRLARRLALEVGAEWNEGAVTEGKYRTAVSFPKT